MRYFERKLNNILEGIWTRYANGRPIGEENIYVDAKLIFPDIDEYLDPDRFHLHLDSLSQNQGKIHSHRRGEWEQERAAEGTKNRADVVKHERDTLSSTVRTLSSITPNCTIYVDPSLFVGDNILGVKATRDKIKGRTNNFEIHNDQLPNGSDDILWSNNPDKIKMWIGNGGTYMDRTVNESTSGSSYFTPLFNFLSTVYGSSEGIEIWKVVNSASSKCFLTIDEEALDQYKQQVLSILSKRLTPNASFVLTKSMVKGSVLITDYKRRFKDIHVIIATGGADTVASALQHIGGNEVPYIDFKSSRGIPNDHKIKISVGKMQNENVEINVIALRALTDKLQRHSAEIFKSGIYGEKGSSDETILGEANRYIKRSAETLHYYLDSDRYRNTYNPRLIVVPESSSRMALTFAQEFSKFRGNIPIIITPKNTDPNSININMNGVREFVRRTATDKKVIELRKRDFRAAVEYVRDRWYREVVKLANGTKKLKHMDRHLRMNLSNIYAKGPEFERCANKDVIIIDDITTFNTTILDIAKHYYDLNKRNVAMGAVIWVNS